MADVVIIGGGVIGLTAAYELAGEGLAVEVLDQVQFGREASWAGAGLLPPGNLSHAKTPEAKLRAASHKLWPRLTAELREATGIDNGYVNCGGIEMRVGGPKGQLDDLAQSWRDEGVEIEELDTDSALELEPNLNPETVSAFRLPEKCQVRNPRHVKALVAACATRNVNLSAGTRVVGFTSSNGKYTGVRTTQETIQAGQILVCAGAWTGKLMASVGFQVPVRPVRGQMVLMSTNALPVRHLLGYGSRYLVPRPDGRILVGSTEEWVGFHKQNTAGGVAELLRFAATLVPSLVNVGFEQCWSGLRPESADHLPYLGSVGGTENLFVAAGHFRSGLQMSPASALLIRQTMLGQEPMIPIEPYAVGRSGSFSDGG